jgi:hypothetical protein
LGLDSGSAVMAPLLLTTQAKFCRSMVTRHWPTIWPESLIPYTAAGSRNVAGACGPSPGAMRDLQGGAAVLC